jgi:hypothetical protein
LTRVIAGEEEEMPTKEFGDTVRAASVARQLTVGVWVSAPRGDAPQGKASLVGWLTRQERVRIAEIRAANDR